MKILITGITGRIGASLAAQLLQQGHDIRGLVWPRDPEIEKIQQLGIELMSGSLTDSADVQRAMAGIEAVYHFGAAFQGGGPFTIDEYFEINVRGTFNMLEAARQSDTLQQFFFASSDALYEKYVPGGLTEPITEAMPRKPSSTYALTKMLGEDLCQGYWRIHRLPVTIFRFSMVFGPGEILAFPQFYLSAMKNSKPELKARWAGEEHLVALKDEQGRYFKKHVADVRDIVSGCLVTLGQEVAFGEIFQLAGPEAFTWDEAVYHLSDKLEIPYLDVTISGAPTFYEFDLSKARTLLGFQPKYNITCMIDDAMKLKIDHEQ